MDQIEVKAYVGVLIKSFKRKSTRVTNPQNPDLCSYSMCSWISVVSSLTAVCVCSHFLAGPSDWTAVKPFSETSLWMAVRRSGSGPTQSVNLQLTPQPMALCCAAARS